ncbi:hypothetical protein BpHYR1_028051 [Brachionus plicatilis]|uniref:Uncharacterized protein n=1 Tax=Brachionus plicatilis TaxID=10195 RepID=A0A3M7SC79_BRAPC|nr:hypothetical protein BpHYR1_028051 [Brachionus plicatilis]
MSSRKFELCKRLLVDSLLPDVNGEPYRLQFTQVAHNQLYTQVYTSLRLNDVIKLKTALCALVEFSKVWSYLGASGSNGTKPEVKPQKLSILSEVHGDSKSHPFFSADLC